MERGMMWNQAEENDDVVLLSGVCTLMGWFDRALAGRAAVHEDIENGQHLLIT